MAQRLEVARHAGRGRALHRDPGDDGCLGDDDLPREQVPQLRRRRLRARARPARRRGLVRPRRVAAATMSFVHLHTHSEYSMLDGAARVKHARRAGRRIRDAGARDHRPRLHVRRRRLLQDRPQGRASSRSSAARSTSRPTRAASATASPTSTTCCCLPRTTRATATSWRSSPTRRSTASTTSRRSTWSCSSATPRGSSAPRRA